MLVIALDTPVDPPDAADATFATDNFQAGKLIGAVGQGEVRRRGQAGQDRDARPERRTGSPSTSSATRASCPASASTPPTRPRSATSPTRGSSATTSPTAPRTAAGPRWRTSCRRTRRSTSSTRSTSRPRRAPTPRCKAAGKEKDVTIVSVDGGCPGVAAVKAGKIGATSQQYPLKMAQEGVDAVVAFAKDGTKPKATAGKTFTDTGVTLITDQAAGRGRRPRTPPSASRTAGADGPPPGRPDCGRPDPFLDDREVSHDRDVSSETLRPGGGTATRDARARPRLRAAPSPSRWACASSTSCTPARSWDRSRSCSCRSSRSRSSAAGSSRRPTSGSCSHRSPSSPCWHWVRRW